MRLRRRSLTAVTCSFLAGVTACQDPANTPHKPQPDEVAVMPGTPNITGIVPIYGMYPWLWNRERTRVVGISVGGLFLKGPEGKGVFGDGVIHPRLYEMRRNADTGKKEPRLIQEWTFDNEQALPWRSKEPKDPLGWGYGLRLVWKDGLDLGSREVRLVISFESSNGHVVTSSPKDMIIPAGVQ